MAQSVERLATDMTLRRLYPGEGEIFVAVQTDPRSTPTHPAVNRYGSFPGIKRLERGAGHRQPLLLGYKWFGALSPPPLCFCIGMSWGDLHLYRNITLLFLYNTSFKQVSYFLDRYIFPCTPHGVI